MEQQRKRITRRDGWNRRNGGRSTRNDGTSRRKGPGSKMTKMKSETIARCSREAEEGTVYFVS